ncbi:unnamed protein product [Dovyalis caffra]|uniref:Apple domain-containing protein n=1 Tax=Dovyalis caffra TaxID=77055 RepID=A0AAV1SJD0_9ROSI|nr:unnamed protein product [Dovyalis caffra]
MYRCSCLPGYEPKNPWDWLQRDGLGGCVRKRQESSTVCGHGEGFVKVEIKLLCDTSAAVWLDMSMSRADCEQECKQNCSCSAYAGVDVPGKGSGCLTWYGGLIDTVQSDRNDIYDLYVRVDVLELAEYAIKSNGSHEWKEMLAMLVPSVASAWFVISLCAYFCVGRGGKENQESALVANELQESRNDADLEFFKHSTISAVIHLGRSASMTIRSNVDQINLLSLEMIVKRRGIEDLSARVVRETTGSSTTLKPLD